MLELFNSISLDKTSKTALYTQLYESLKNMIASGTLLPDYRLPSVRQLSELLRINQVTAVSAYKRLEKEGFVYSKPGSGTYVENMLYSTGIRNQTHSSTISDELYHQDDLAFINNGQIKIDENTINFASATPTPDLFPVEDFKLALNEVLERDRGNAFGYQENQGFYELRECISKILQKSSVYCTPENIQVISGAQQGIDIISKAFLNQGDFVVTESPTYTGAIAVFRSRGAQIVDVALDKDGPNLNILEYSLKKYRPKLIYTIPSFQNPTGHSYSNYKRSEVLKLAERYNAYIIEDDYVSDLDFEGKSFTPLKTLDKNNRVIFIKSFSKIFMPGLRLGFMVVPPSLQGNIMEAKHTTDISTSGLIQRAFDLYIRKGFWDRHFKFMYEVYKQRYERIIRSLDVNLAGNISYSKPGGGLNIWLNLPYDISINNLFKLASSSNIVFAPGKIFYSSNCPHNLNNIRISFAAAYTEQIETGIEKLCSIIGSLDQKHEIYSNMPIL